MADDYNWGQGLQGAAGGAMAGSFAGPIGAGIGGAIGGLMGLFGGNSDQQAYSDQLRQLSAGYGKMTAPQMGGASQAGYSNFRQNQAGLIAQLEAMARGEGPSAAAIQMRDAMDKATAAQASAAAGAGGRGVNAGQATRLAMNNTAAIQSQAARDTSVLRAQEQANAIGMLGQTIAQGRGADEATNQFNADANNRVGLANLQAKLQTMGITTDAQLRALLGAAGMAQPGIGTSIMAGGASAMPGLLQMMQARNAPNPGAYNPNRPGYDMGGNSHNGGYDADGNGYGYDIPGGY